MTTFPIYTIYIYIFYSIYIYARLRSLHIHNIVHCAFMVCASQSVFFFVSPHNTTVCVCVCVCDDVCPRTRNAFKTQTYINSIKRKKHTHRTYHAIESTYGNSFCELLAESLHRSFCSFFCLFFILYSFYRFVISCSGWKLLYSSFVQSFLLAFCHHQREHIIYVPVQTNMR